MVRRKTPSEVAARRTPAARRRHVAAEALEPRRLLNADSKVVAADPEVPVPAGEALPPSAALAPSGLPLLHSLPGAPVAIFLDFDGHLVPDQYAPYDTDGDDTSFGPAEQEDIARMWRHVASDFSMFDVDVTTQRPLVPYSHSIISNSVLGGSYNRGSFPSPSGPVNIHSSFEARARPTALAHEIGHSFGLQHQSYYDALGNKVLEYNPGYDALHGPVMGNDTAQRVNKWFIGHPSNSAELLQNDVAVIGGLIAAYSAGGDGHRPDDHGGDAARATALADEGGGMFSAGGIIERMADADAFSFDARGGPVRLSVDPPAPSMLDAKLELYAADGTLLAAADGAANDQHLELALPAGRYVAVVRSHGDYGDLGPYDLTVEPGAPTPDEPFDPALGAPGALALSAGAAGVGITWSAVEGASGYAVERSDDGAAWHLLDSAGAETTSLSDAPELGGHRYFYRVRTLGGVGAGRSAPSPAASVVTRPAAPREFTLAYLRGNAVLNWRDVAGETGYRVERTDEPPDSDAPWDILARLGANVPGIFDFRLLGATRYRYRVIAEGPGGNGAPSDEVALRTPLTSVRDLRVSQTSSSGIVLVWAPIGDAAGYTVERSIDGETFEPVGAAGASAAPTYRDDTVTPARRYYYRVTGTNTFGESASSGVVTAVSSGTTLPTGWTRTDVGMDPGSPPTSAPVAFIADTGAFNLIGGGDGLVTPGGGGRSGDSLRTVWRGLPGTGFIAARLTWQDRSPLGMAGVMLRESSDAGARFVFAGVSPTLGVGSVSRSSVNGRSSGFARIADARPCWLRVVRAGQLVSAQVLEGTHWRVLSSQSVATGNFMQAALVVSSGDGGTVAAASFDSVTVRAGGPVVVDEPAPMSTLREGRQLELYVLAADDSGEDQLTYTWSAAGLPPGAGPPEFSRNGTNDAKFVTVTFSAAGHYLLGVKIGNPLGRSVTATVAVDVARIPTALVVEPSYVAVRAGASAQLTATLTDQFGTPYVPASPVEWSGWYGTVDEAGRYTAPPDPWQWDWVTASVDGVSDSTDVYVYDDSAVTLLSAVSRKVHGRRGVADLPLVLYGAPAVIEPRRGGPTTLVFTFSGPVAPFDGALSPEDLSITNAAFRSARVAGNVLTLELGGVADGRLVSVGFSGIGDTRGAQLVGDGDVDVLALYGDANRDGAVTRADLSPLRTRLLRAPSTADLLYDLDLSGAVTAADLSACRRRMGLRRAEVPVRHNSFSTPGGPGKVVR